MKPHSEVTREITANSEEFDWRWSEAEGCTIGFKKIKAHRDMKYLVNHVSRVNVVSEETGLIKPFFRLTVNSDESSLVLSTEDHEFLLCFSLYK